MSAPAMLVDSPPPPPSPSSAATYAASSAFEDFFNMDMLAGTSSRASSQSPPLPPTPPQALSLPPDSFFNFALLDDDFTKPDILPAPPLPTSAAPYDFIGAFAHYAAASSASSSSPSSDGQSSHSPASFSAVSPQAMLAIDPQLVGTPSKALSDVDEEDEGAHDSDEEGNEENVPVQPVKAGGKGKARKGTVQSGGIVKRAAPGGASAAVRDKSPKDRDDDLDDWRPSPEEYKKMSSKEKRQLRNKISARNFRVRRKEYITTLEGDIAERDRLIDAIRTELGSTKNENVALRSEIDALKRALLGGNAADAPVLPPPGPLPAIPAAITATASAAAAAKSPLLTPNTQKDLPSSPRLAGSSRQAFWAGNASAFGGFTPVHTTLVPDVPAFADAPTSGKRPLQENLNPGLNLPSQAAQQHGQTRKTAPAFDAFADMNPFTLKTLDAYRMQLWGTMAAYQHAARLQRQAQGAQQQAAPGSPQPPAVAGLAASMRPAFFTSKNSSSALSGKAAAAAYPSPPASPQLSARDVANPHVVAALASQTLLRRLGGAFWDAFSGAPGKAATPGLDADKVRRVLDGTAVLRVVDVDPPAPAPLRPMSSSRMGVATALQERPQAPVPASMADRACGAAAQSCCTITDLLEESMRSLSISKKSSV